MSKLFDRRSISMELGTQIRKYRNERTLSQEALAEKVYVSRQTVSNWENDKSYPDVNSLVLLSEVFEISLDQLIKDVEMMKEQIDQTDQKACHLDRDTGSRELCGNACGTGEEKVRHADLSGNHRVYRREKLKRD